ncbi:MAG: DNA repair exonuclease [Armatimonadetes bacterium]|nr:DNA repair exonuclease [Armatimonadota bacterium]
MVTLLHLADLHLDTPFKGLAETDEALAIRLRDATLNALDRAVAFALEQRQRGRLDAVTFGGDIFDATAPSLRARMRFGEALKMLCREGISCFIIGGNHDPIDDFSLWRRHVSLPEGCTLFDAEWGAGVIEKDGAPACTVVGRSFSQALSAVNPLTGLEERAAALDATPLRVGLLHCDAGGSMSGENGYAPVSVGDLARAPVKAWLLGHIHKRSEKPLHARPLVVYPGNPQGRDINEAGPKGGLLVHLEPGRDPQTEFVPFGSILWARVEVAVSECADDIAVTEAIHDALQTRLDEAARAGAEGLIARVTLAGRPELSTWRLLQRPETLEEIRKNAAGAMETPFLVIEQLESRVQAPLPPREELLARDDLLGDFLRVLDQARANPESDARSEVEKVLGAFSKIPGAREFGGIPGPEMSLEELLNAAESVALTLLWDEEDALASEEVPVQS